MKRIASLFSDKKTIYYNLSLTFVSMFGIGFLPKAPGTWGSAAALIVLFIPVLYRFEFLLTLIFICLVIAVPAIKLIEKKHGLDPGFVVIDEAIGMWLILLSTYIYFDWIRILIAFVLFRIFDILKPGPIKKLNMKEGAVFVLADDILAAVFTSLILHIINRGIMLFPLVLEYYK